MKNDKLLRLLSTFDRADFKKFQKFLTSPFFNSNPLLSEVFELLITYKAQFINPEFKLDSKISFFSKKLKTNEVKITKAFSEIYNHTESYIYFTLLEKDSILKYVLLLEFALNKNNFKTFEQTYKKAVSFLEKNIKKNETYFYYKLKLNILHYDYLAIKNNRVLEENFIENILILDKFYWIQKLKLILYQSNKAIVLNVEYNDSVLKEILLEIENLKKSEDPYVLIFSEMLLLTHSKEKEANFYALKELLKKYPAEIKDGDLRNAYITLTNSALRIFPQEKLYYELFKLDQEKINSDLHKVNNETIPADFNNIVTSALGVNKFEWTLDFIKSEGEKLPKDVKEDYILFNKARCSFYIKNYEECISLLACCKPTDVIFKSKIKRLYLKASFEQREYSLFESTAHSFKMFLFRDKEMVKKNNKANADFLSFTTKLFKLSLVSNISNKKKLEKLEEQIKGKRVPEKKWLLEKIVLLKK